MEPSDSSFVRVDGSGKITRRLELFPTEPKTTTTGIGVSIDADKKAHCQVHAGPRDAADEVLETSSKKEEACDD